MAREMYLNPLKGTRDVSKTTQVREDEDRPEVSVVKTQFRTAASSPGPGGPVSCRV